ncbi:MAG: TonB-dependent siderophore receptor [Planctomycetes bacterium]|nr:TonB-dependent siderophore receptor [Planctomycetota bacterium]
MDTRSRPTRVTTVPRCFTLFAPATLILASETAAAPRQSSAEAAGAQGVERRFEARSQDAREPKRNQDVSIPEVVVTESKTSAVDAVQGTPLDNPAARDVLSPREVAEAGTLNVQELLRRTPSVILSEESGSDSLPNVALRGVTGNDGVFRSTNLSMYVDGIPLASAPYGQAGASGFPLTLERVWAIDVQRGGASVKYGPNNVSGVVNYLTKPIPERATFETVTKYDSFDNLALYESYGDTLGRFGFLLEAVYKDGNGYRQHSDYVLQNYSLKTAWAFSDELRMLVQVEKFDDDSDQPDGLNLADFEADPLQSKSLQNRFTFDQDRANVRLEWDLDRRTRAELSTYYYDTHRAFEIGSPSYYGSTANYVQATPRPMSVFAIQPQVTHGWDFGDVHSELVAGVRYLREDIERRTERNFPNGSQIDVNGDESTYHTGSAFVENEFTFGRWKVRPGVRYEAMDLSVESTIGATAGNTGDEYFDELLPALSASYLLRDDWSLYASASTTLQPPAVTALDLADHDQDLGAQFARQYELGTRVQALDDSLAIDLCAYQIDYTDRLEQDPNNFNVFENVGSSRHQGVELTCDKDLSRELVDGLSVWSAVAYNDSEYTNGLFDGNQLPSAPHWLASWGVRWAHEPSGVTLALDGAYVGHSYSDRLNTEDINAAGTLGVKPQYTLWNAHAGWMRRLSDGCKLRLGVHARNVFDEEYFDVRAARGIFVGAPFGLGAEIGLTFEF